MKIVVDVVAALFILSMLAINLLLTVFLLNHKGRKR
jgi:hypothetical protein